MSAWLMPDLRLSKSMFTAAVLYVMCIMIAASVDILQVACQNRAMQKKENNETQAAQEMQQIIRNNIRMILARYPQNQSTFAEALGLAQGSVSRKLNGKAEWTSSDIANAAAYFGLPFYVLVSPTALKDYLFADAQTNYQLDHYGPVDNSRRELAAPTGARYLRRPDDGNGLQGQAGPRAFMRVEDDFFGAKQVSGSAASRRRMLSAPCGTRTRKPEGDGF